MVTQRKKRILMCLVFLLSFILLLKKSDIVRLSTTVQSHKMDSEEKSRGVRKKGLSDFNLISSENGQNSTQEGNGNTNTTLSRAKDHILNKKYAKDDQRKANQKASHLNSSVGYEKQENLNLHQPKASESVEMKMNYSIQLNSSNQAKHKKNQQSGNSYSLVDAAKELKEPVIYVVTPTFHRPTQAPDMTRLAQTLNNVKSIHWIIIEDSLKKTYFVQDLVHRHRFNHTHLIQTSPERDIKRRVIFNFFPIMSKGHSNMTRLCPRL